jgi:hypothetical protein
MPLIGVIASYRHSAHTQVGIFSFQEEALVRRRVPQPSDSEVSTLIDPATGLPSESTSMSFSDNGRTALEDEPVPFTLARYLSRCTHSRGTPLLAGLNQLMKD